MKKILVLTLNLALLIQPIFAYDVFTLTGINNDPLYFEEGNHNETSVTVQASRMLDNRLSALGRLTDQVVIGQSQGGLRALAYIRQARASVGDVRPIRAVITVDSPVAGFEALRNREETKAKLLLTGAALGDGFLAPFQAVINVGVSAASAGVLGGSWQAGAWATVNATFATNAGLFFLAAGQVEKDAKLSSMIKVFSNPSSAPQGLADMAPDSAFMASLTGTPPQASNVQWKKVAIAQQVNPWFIAQTRLNRGTAPTSTPKLVTTYVYKKVILPSATAPAPTPSSGYLVPMGMIRGSQSGLVPMGDDYSQHTLSPMRGAYLLWTGYWTTVLTTMSWQAWANPFMWWAAPGLSLSAHQAGVGFVTMVAIDPIWGGILGSGDNDGLITVKDQHRDPAELSGVGVKYLGKGKQDADVDVQSFDQGPSDNHASSESDSRIWGEGRKVNDPPFKVESGGYPKSLVADMLSNVGGL